MLSNDKTTESYFIVDEFCQEFESVKEVYVLPENTSKKQRNRNCNLSDSEVITIMILFHAGGFRHLNHFYTHYVQVHMRQDYPRTVSYNRFVELQRKAAMPLAIFLKTCCLGECTGVSFIDLTPIRACHTQRERSNKVFKGLAAKGQCSIGWFFGFKLHLIINDRGEILDFMLTQGNVDDREPLRNKSFHNKIFGKLFDDKGYICKTFFEQLFINGIHRIT